MREIQESKEIQAINHRIAMTVTTLILIQTRLIFKAKYYIKRNKNISNVRQKISNKK